MSAASRGERRRPIWRDRRSLVVIGVVMLLVASAGTPAALWLTRPRQAQLVVVNAGERPSAMIEDGSERVLILNTDDREEALGLASRLSPMLAPAPDIVVAPAGDEFAPALLAVVEQNRPARVIVAGVPGAAPAWAAVEQASRRHGVDLRYVAEMATFDTAALRVGIIGTRDDEQAAVVVVQRGGASVAIVLSNGRLPAAAQVIVTADASTTTDADLVVATGAAGRPQRLTVVIKRGDLVRVAIAPTAVRIYGGERREPPGSRAQREELVDGQAGDHHQARALR